VLLSIALGPATPGGLHKLKRCTFSAQVWDKLSNPGMGFSRVNLWVLGAMKNPETETLLTFLDNVSDCASEMDTVWIPVFLA